MSRNLIQISVLLKEVKTDILTINQALFFLALTLHSMPKNTGIHTHCIDVPSAVEIARRNVGAKREIIIMETKLKNRQTLQLFRGI